MQAFLRASLETVAFSPDLYATFLCLL